ncbi:MAG: glycogen debranching protein GlgX [Gemmataceae bacterium]|nr:glycogen debranching protein GlgX [Gemmataceae bacterium]
MNRRKKVLPRQRDLTTSRGRSLPLGATPERNGVNFVLPCRHGTSVSLVLLPAEEGEPFAEFLLDPRIHRTGNYWHILVLGLPSVFAYAWRVDGPRGPLHRYDPKQLLLDPAATTIAGAPHWGRPGNRSSNTAPRRAVFRSGRHFNWGDDHPPLIPPEDSIIYELHVRGYTCHPSSGVEHPGTFSGLQQKLSHLTDLGITAIELLPIHEFDELDCPFTNPGTGEPNRNLWGYNSIAFAAPKASYAAGGAKHRQVDEFRSLVKQCHISGLEVILDVVFNHTAEGDDRGRTYSFRGIDNSLFYHLAHDGTYRNFTGCGNTVNCNHPVTRELLMNCLHYWVAGMHVDGFRFDLASVLGRDRQGHVLVEPPVVESIVEDGLLADTKLIAEPWDAAGLYQVGEFPFGRRWSEWNGRYRDDVRRFWRKDRNTAGLFATRICGSADLYQPAGRSPYHSINFITCHDGFTLVDLLSFNKKQNHCNGEDNRDGTDQNFSWNCGVEGPTDDPAINRLRHRMARNLMATLLLSQGVPMILGGDEFLRTQRGNNNAWCQDNEISWVDWSLADIHAEHLAFVKMLVAFRKAHPTLRRRSFLRGDGDGQRPADATWHTAEGNRPDFGPDCRAFGLLLNGRQTGREIDADLYMFFNSGENDLQVVLPTAPNGGTWTRSIDTAVPSIALMAETGAPVCVAGESVVVWVGN